MNGNNDNNDDIIEWGGWGGRGVDMVGLVYENMQLNNMSDIPGLENEKLSKNCMHGIIIKFIMFGMLQWADVVICLALFSVVDVIIMFKQYNSYEKNAYLHEFNILSMLLLLLLLLAQYLLIE